MHNFKHKSALVSIIATADPNNLVYVEFIKVDSSLRRMIFMMRDPDSGEAIIQRTKGVLTVFDVIKRDYRNVVLENVRYLASRDVIFCEDGYKPTLS